MHAFLKLPRPVDIPDPLESESPFIPILFVNFFLGYASTNSQLHRRYRYPAGAARGSASSSPTLQSPSGGSSADIRGDPEGNLLIRSCCAVVGCSSTSKQHIFVTSFISLCTATGPGTWEGGSLGSGTAVHSAPKTSVQIVRKSTHTTALTLSSWSRLALITRHSGRFFLVLCTDRHRR